MVQLSELVSDAVPLLASVVSQGVPVAQGVATRLLGDMVADRFARTGHGSAWEDFKQSPQNDSLTRHLLQQMLRDDPGFRVRFESALQAALAEQKRKPGSHSIHITGSGQAQIGDRGDSFNNSRVATRGGTYREGDVHNQHNRVTNKKGSAGAVVVLAVVAIVVIGLVVLLVKGVPALLNRMHDGGLTASSTCQQFLNTDEQTEQQALVDIAMSKGIGGFGSPLALPEIRYECSSTPGMTLGAIVERDKGQY